LRDLIRYGPVYLTEAEYKDRLEKVIGNYYQFLATSFFNRTDRAFWSWHQDYLAEIGYPLYGLRLSMAVCAKFLDLLLNPKLTVERILQRRRNTAD